MELSKVPQRTQDEFCHMQNTAYSARPFDGPFAVLTRIVFADRRFHPGGGAP
jgi:hypothetical protein